jgi:hypothetical protein
LTVPVTNIAIEVQSDYECGNYVNYTRLRCTADGFPAPEFTWTDVSSGEVFATDTITLSTAGENEYVCTARNEIRDQETVLKSQITVNVSDGKWRVGHAHSLQHCSMQRSMLNLRELPQSWLEALTAQLDPTIGSSEYTRAIPRLINQHVFRYLI